MPGSIAPAHDRALDVLAGLLPELEEELDAPGSRFFDRLCEAVCRLVGLERAGLVLYDKARQLVIPVGSHGVDPAIRAQIYGTLEETPMAQTALAENRVVVSSDLTGQLPDRYASFAGITTLACVPVSAGGRWLGVIFADRGGRPFDLSEEERQTMLAFGKGAALAATARIGAVQAMRARELASRLDLARELHESVVQRLFGISLALGSEHELSQVERERISTEIGEALTDMRTTIAQPLRTPPLDTGITLVEELERLRGHHASLPISVDWEPGVEAPAGHKGLAQAVLAEGLRNCAKHADPTEVLVRVGRDGGAFTLEVANDGAHASESKSAGMGLRLAALEAMGARGMVEFGPQGEDRWRVRLVLPSPEDGG